jgi:hypothetical protein
MQAQYSNLVPSKINSLINAGALIYKSFQRQEKVSVYQLKTIMTEACGGSDADGYWVWKEAYEAVEIGLVHYLISYQRQNSQVNLEDLIGLEKLYTAHNKRSDKSEKLQQFSTPVTLSYLANQAAQINNQDIVLEPSAGNGLLAVFAAMNCYELVLNEIDPLRAAALDNLFCEARVSQHNAEQINDRLNPGVRPTVVLMNPPFSSYLNRDVKRSSVIFEHLNSALNRLEPYGRLVMICQDSIRPNNPIWRRKFDQLQSKATVIASVGVEGNIYAKQGTTVDTRITVIDKIPAASPRQFIETMPCMNLTDLSRIIAQVSPRSKQLKIAALAAPIVEQESLFDLSSVPKTTNIIPFPRTAITVPKVEVEAKTEAKVNWSEVEPVKYIQNHWNKELSQPQGLFAPYQIEGIKLSGCQSHPTDAVESIAMASIQSPSCSYQPLLPKQIIEQGILSDIQLETIIRAGEAHSKLLNKWVKIDENNKVRHYPYAEPDARQERQGYLCGDGTGIGKGRQIAGVILDNWLQGKTKAVWLSITPNLIEDARRDWQDLGGKSEQIISQSSFKPNQKIDLNEGILFTTYRTLARPETTKNQSRLEQIIDWLGEDFAGIIAFDECHAMAGALPTKGTRGTQKASLQGLAGLRIQHQLPNARIMYVSATGASKIQNLAYAERLGLWGTQNSAFSDRQVFIEKIGNSGIAAMEIISRELKAQGLYLARSLSYQGIEYQTLEHKLTPEQVEIYNQYAKAFEIIHNNISEALSCTCTNEESSLTSAQGTAYSAFESIKQRFFNQLLISMSSPSLIAAIEADIAAGFAPILQITSTNEAMLQRTLEAIPVEEWNDLKIDISPRFYILDFLNNSFPVYLMETIEQDGHTYTSYAKDAQDNKILNQEAVMLKEALIIKIMELPTIHSALDQIIFYFGYENIAEITGRSLRLEKYEDNGQTKIRAKKRDKNANIADAEKFQNDEIQILAFSKSGGTGRSYHASLKIPNQRLRKHYLVESGWNATDAIQGFGRSHRSHQAQPPVYILVTTDVKGQKRFTSSIAQRLATLGAITKGQAETGNNGLFKAEDSLNNEYAQAALSTLISQIRLGALPECSLETLEAKTGLHLQYEGALLPTPPMNRFLNRLLALEVDLQNYLFEHLDRRIKENIAEAKESGHYQTGVETINAHSIQVVEKLDLWQDPESKAKTVANRVIQENIIEYTSVQQALAEVTQYSTAQLVFNERSNNVGYTVPIWSETCAKTGKSIEQIHLKRPDSVSKQELAKFQQSNWKPITEAEFSRLWQLRLNELPKYSTTNYYIISGLLLPIWDRLQGDLKVRRIVTDDGEAILGRVISDYSIENVFKEFNQEIETTPETIYQRVIGGQAAKVTDILRLKLSKVMGSERIEVMGWNDSVYQQLIAIGCTSERISWQQRVFIPIEKAIAVIERIINNC